MLLYVYYFINYYYIMYNFIIYNDNDNFYYEKLFFIYLLLKMNIFVLKLIIRLWFEGVIDVFLNVLVVYYGVIWEISIVGVIIIYEFDVKLVC